VVRHDSAWCRGTCATSATTRKGFSGEVKAHQSPLAAEDLKVGHVCSLGCTHPAVKSPSPGFTFRRRINLITRPSRSTVDDLTGVLESYGRRDGPSAVLQGTLQTLKDVGTAFRKLGEKRYVPPFCMRLWVGGEVELAHRCPSGPPGAGSGWWAISCSTIRESVQSAPKDK
jgi:hypothetical protein